MLVERGALSQFECLTVESLVCGYRLNSLVFGSSSIQISTLSLELADILKDCIPLIAQSERHFYSLGDRLGGILKWGLV
jgi:hypothetical protein